METILLLIKNKPDRRRLGDWLAKVGQVLLPEDDALPEKNFDLGIIDGRSLKQLRARLLALRRTAEPVLLPFLLVTQRRGNQSPLHYLGGPVDDLILRPLNQNEVIARVQNLLRLRRLSLELKKKHDLVLKLSVTDDVTGFYNTRYLYRFLDRRLSSPSARNEPLSLVFFDLDNFKRVVDAHGHLVGARTLKEVAQAVHRATGEHDRIVRYGGDEFVVILPGQTKSEALAKVERMKAAVSGTRFLQRENLDIRLTASFGLATYPDDARDKLELLAAADHCLFRSKSAGKNRISSSGIGFDHEEDFAPAEAA